MGGKLSLQQRARNWIKRSDKDLRTWTTGRLREMISGEGLSYLPKGEPSKEALIEFFEHLEDNATNREVLSTLMTEWRQEKRKRSKQFRPFTVSFPMKVWQTVDKTKKQGGYRSHSDAILALMRQSLDTDEDIRRDLEIIAKKEGDSLADRNARLTKERNDLKARLDLTHSALKKLEAHAKDLAYDLSTHDVRCEKFDPKPEASGDHGKINESYNERKSRIDTIVGLAQYIRPKLGSS